jgi:hypothetical protein
MYSMLELVDWQSASQLPVTLHVWALLCAALLRLSLDIKKPNTINHILVVTITHLLDMPHCLSTTTVPLAGRLVQRALSES